MLSRKDWFGVFVALLAQNSPMSAYASNESVLKDLKAFLSIPERTDHFRRILHGDKGMSPRKCTVWIDADPGYLMVRIQIEKSPISPAQIDLPASGVGRAGDRIDVTKVAQFPATFLLTTYYERRTGSKEKGDLTMVAAREVEGPLLSLSISDGQGIMSCVNLEPETLSDEFSQWAE